MKNSSIEEFLKIMGEYKSSVISNCVQFSTTLLGENYTGDILKEDYTVKAAAIRTDSSQKMTAFESMTSQKSIEVLLKNWRNETSFAMVAMGIHEFLSYALAAMIWC